MKILTFTELFPNCINPNKGVFIKERMFNFAMIPGCDIRVVAPVPYFPPIRIQDEWFSYSKVPLEEDIEGIKVYHPRYLLIPKVGMSFYGLSIFLSVLKKVIEIKKQFDFDLIDSHWVYPDGFAAVLLAKYLNKPIVVSARGSDINIYSKSFLIRNLIVFTLRNASRIITVSQALKNRIVELGLQESRTEVIPNGIDIRKFQAISKDKARISLNLPLGKKIILTIAALRKIKGLPLLIKAMYDIVNTRRRRDTLLLIIGEGEERDHLIDLIRQFNLEDHIKLLGPKSHINLFRWYSAADIFCLPSINEGWPNVIFESFACGKPVVASGVGGIPEIITSDDYGFLVHERNKEAFAYAIIRALDRKWNSDYLIEYAKRNTWSQISIKLKDIFENVL